MLSGYMAKSNGGKVGLEGEGVGEKEMREDKGSK